MSPTDKMPTLVGNIRAIMPQGAQDPTQVGQTKYKEVRNTLCVTHVVIAA